MPMNYYPANSSSFYMQDLQNMRDRIDRQMQQLQQSQHQAQQPAQPITQNFQLAPTQPAAEIESKYATNIDEVKNTFVMKTGVFLTKDFSTLWIKDVTGNIRTFKTEEVIEMDEKDREIFELKKQIEDMKGMMSNAVQYDNTNVDEPVATKKSTRVSSNSKSDAK